MGDAPNSDLAAFLRGRSGLEIDAGFVPVLKASARDLERLEAARKAAKEAVEKAAKKPTGDQSTG